MPYPDTTERNDATSAARQQYYEPITRPWYYTIRDKQYRSGLIGEINRLIDHVTHNDTEGVDIRDQGELKQGNSRLAMELDDRLQHNNNPFGLAYNTLLPIVATAGMAVAPAAAAKGILQGVAANSFIDPITGTSPTEALSPYIGYELSQALMFNPVRKTGVNASTVLNAASKQGGTKLVRKYAPASEPPVYTAETAPKTVKLNGKDITEYHVNDGEGSLIMTPREQYYHYNNVFNNLEHGRAIRVGEDLTHPDSGLSTKSFKDWLHLLNMNTREGKGIPFVPEGEPTMVKLNKVAQNRPDASGHLDPDFSVSSPERTKRLNEYITRIRKLNENGFDFPLPEIRYEQPRNMFKPGTPQYDYVKMHSKPKEFIYVPNIAFLKFKNGGKNV